MAATLKQIAEAAGVSVRTVNRALKEQSGINSGKRLEILAVASRLGYVPNIAARNLRLRKSSFVGIVAGMNDNDISIRKIHDLQQRLELRGFFPIIGALQTGPDAVRTMLREWAGLADTVALLAWGGWPPDTALAALPQQFIFVDCLPPSAGQCEFHQLCIDRSSGIRDAVLFLLESGRLRIFHCGNIPNRVEGIEKAFGSFHGRAEKVTLETGGSEFEDGYRQGPMLVKAQADAVFFDTDRMAFGFLKYAWERGINIPRDIAVVGFDDNAWGNYSCPSLSTVAHPIAEMNEKIVELARLRPESRETVVFPTKFVKRQSV